MRIGQLAGKAGVGVETVRFYERRGLIEQPLKPQSNGFRSYPTELVSRIRFIRHAQTLGFTLGEIEELLALRTDPATDCADVQDRAKAKRAEVSEKIVALKQIQNALDRLIQACPGVGATEACSILQELETPSSRACKSKQSNMKENDE
ncbi:MAG: MerR family DNA-binding protein [Rhodospirillales bacterium]